ncbi:ABC transporter ATP-binding protein [Corynebacterium sp. A21]|uniref:ABC transporter ATP-binding protein n=1 Tax=Corynebacterium sp. A21 TaxID=3457318 RepID=UPI003FD2059F
MSEVYIFDIHKSFGDVAALHDINVSVASGENLAILGPSGSGKSTLLRIIAGLETPDGGEINFDGKSQKGIRPEDRDVSIVFQSYALYPHLSNRENITLGLRHGKKLSRIEADKRATEIASVMQVEHLLDRKPKQLSGGQRQRIALARALARRTSIVLLDEPLSGLDAQLHATLRVEISALLQSVGATGINVTHDQGDAMAMADRIVVLNKGRIEQLGTPDELYQVPETLFVASFVGTPPMNLFAVEERKSVFGSHRFPGTGEITVGVRPERLYPGIPPVDSPDIWRLRGRIVLVEPAGRERIVHIQIKGLETFAVLVQNKDVSPVGTVVDAWCEADHVHVYDNESTKRIGNASELGLKLVRSEQDVTQ